MPWSSVGSFFVNSNDWLFSSPNLDIDSSLSLKLEYETRDRLDVYGLIADVYFDLTLSFSKPIITQTKRFYPTPRGCDLIVFDPPGRFQDPGEGIDLPGGFIWEWDENSNDYRLRSNVWRRLGFKRAFKKRGVQKKTYRDKNGNFLREGYPWMYGSESLDFRVFVDIFV